MIEDSLETMPPDDVQEKITISAEIVPCSSKGVVWRVHCPEWKYESHHSNLTRGIALLVADIERHNDNCMRGRPDWHDEATYADYLGERNGWTSKESDDERDLKKGKMEYGKTLDKRESDKWKSYRKPKPEPRRIDRSNSEGWQYNY